MTQLSCSCNPAISTTAMPVTAPYSAAQAAGMAPTKQHFLRSCLGSTTALPRSTTQLLNSHCLTQHARCVARRKAPSGVQVLSQAQVSQHTQPTSCAAKRLPGLVSPHCLWPPPDSHNTSVQQTGAYLTRASHAQDTKTDPACVYGVHAPRTRISKLVDFWS